MSKDVLEPKLADLMNTIPEVEGVVAFSLDGSVISGQTIESMNLNSIAKESSNLMENLAKFGAEIGKGKVSEITVNLEDGFAVIAFGETYSIIGFMDSGSKMQLGLLSRALKGLVK